MARQLRIQFPGAFYHVMSRGNEKQTIFMNRRDRLKFLEYLGSASDRYGVIIHCYCLMDNHYQLMLETPYGNLAQIMRHINGAYTGYFNAKHQRVGHLFQGRYRSILVDIDTYGLALSRYIHLNPVKECFVASPADYEWSSYGYFLSERWSLRWLKTDLLLSLVSESNESRQKYREYIEEDGDMCFELHGKKATSSVILGPQNFIDEITTLHLTNKLADRDLPMLKKLRTRLNIQKVINSVAEELKKDHRMAKKMSIYICHNYSGFTLKEIGVYFGVSESAVSENSSRFARTLYKDQRLAEMVAGLLAEL